MNELIIYNGREEDRKKVKKNHARRGHPLRGLEESIVLKCDERKAFLIKEITAKIEDIRE